MDVLRYRLADGRYAPRNAVNRHHTIFEKRWYRTHQEQVFRNLSGLVLPLHIQAHEELHAQVAPPPKPSRPFMEQIAEFAHDVYEQDDYEAFYRIAHFIGDVANSSWSPERADEAFRIHENFMQQSQFIEAGRVEPVHVAV